VVIANFNVSRVALSELKADPPLIVDPNTPLAGAVVLQPLQSIPGRNPEFRYFNNSVQHCELSHRNAFEALEARYSASTEHRFRVLTAERLDRHLGWILTPHVINVKRY
jgi:hypothetical protein